MTTEQAVLRFEREAERLDAMGHSAAAHDWRKRASEMAFLARLAKDLPIARSTPRRRHPLGAGNPVSRERRC